MIFPKKKPIKKETTEPGRVRLFAGGGGLGLQYIEQRPDLPDLEGVGMMMQNQAAIDDRVAKARAGIHDSTMLDEEIKPGDFKDAAGGFNSLKAQYNQAYSDWLQKYGNSDDIFSQESKAKIRDMQGVFSLENLATVNASNERNKQEYDQMRKNRLGDNIWINQGSIMLKNPESPEGVTPMSVDEFYAMDPEIRQKYNPMTQQQVIDWKREAQPFNSSINPNVGTGKRFDEVVKTIGDAFTGLGHTSTTSDNLFASTLAREAQAQGLKLDNTKPLYTQIKSKIKQNDKQVQAAITLAARSLSQEDRDAIVQEMIKQDIQPTQENMSQFLGAMITGEASKRRIFEDDTDTSYKNIGAIGAGPEDQMRQDFTSFVINNPIGADAGNGNYVVTMPGAFRTNVKAGDKTIPAGAVRIRNNERKKELSGDTAGTPIRNQKIFIDGQPYLYGTGASGESNGESLAALNKIYWTGDVQEVVEIPPNEITGNTESTKRLRRSVVAHEDDAKELASRMGMDLDELEKRGVVTRVDHDDDTDFASLTSMGLDAEWLKSQYSSMSGKVVDDDFYVINVEEEVNNAILMQRVSNTERVEGYMDRREGEVDAIGQRNSQQTQEVDNLYDN